MFVKKKFVFNCYFVIKRCSDVLILITISEEDVSTVQPISCAFAPSKWVRCESFVTGESADMSWFKVILLCFLLVHFVNLGLYYSHCTLSFIIFVWYFFNSSQSDCDTSITTMKITGNDELIGIAMKIVPRWLWYIKCISLHKNSKYWDIISVMFI